MPKSEAESHHSNCVASNCSSNGDAKGKQFKIFIGNDPREDLAYEACLNFEVGYTTLNELCCSGGFSVEEINDADKFEDEEFDGDPLKNMKKWLERRTRRRFYKSKESEIEDLCRAHYQDFITAVDDLRSLLPDVDSLKTSLYDSNSQLQNVAVPLLTTGMSSLHRCSKDHIAVQLSPEFSSPSQEGRRMLIVLRRRAWKRRRLKPPTFRNSRSDIGKWILFSSPTPINRFVMLRCPSIDFPENELMENVQKPFRLFSFNSLLAACFPSENYDNVLQLLQELPSKLSIEPTVVSCILAVSRCSKDHAAVQLSPEFSSPSQEGRRILAVLRRRAWKHRRLKPLTFPSFCLQENDSAATSGVQELELQF